MNNIIGGFKEKIQHLCKCENSFCNTHENVLHLYKTSKEKGNKIYIIVKEHISIPISIYILVIVLLIISIIIWYKWRMNYRLPKLLKSLEIYPKFVSIRPLTSNKDYKKSPNKWKLCDWYVASSYRPFLPGLQYYDYCSVKSIELLLRSGVRYLELEIYNNSNLADFEPIVTVGNEKGNWHYTLNTITFEECCNTISKYAFSKGIVNNYSDPLFLFLNLQVNNNINTLNRITDILYDVFRTKLLDKLYSYQRTNISVEPISKFLNKIIIISTPGFKHSKLQELINISLDGPFIRRMDDIKAKQTYEPDNLVEYNSLNMTIVYPSFTTRKTQNYSPGLCWLYGCQFVCMNYQNMSNNMDSYIQKFRNYSFLLKPYNLRYHPKTYKKPTKQSPDLYYNALQMKTQFYDYKI